MPDEHATTSYMAEVGSRPIPDARTQLAWAHAIDRAQQSFNRALLDCPQARAQFQRLIAGMPEASATQRWLARCTGASEVSAASCADGVPQDPTPEELHAAMQPLRLRCEFMAEVCAAVRAGDADSPGVHAFLEDAARIQQRIRAATGHLVQANQRLVVTLARRYRHAPMAFMDLVQEGNLGLLRAIERFDPDHGARVSTYAMWWVRRAMVYAIARQGHAVRPPLQQYWSARRMLRALTRLDGARGRRCTLQEAARVLGVSAAEIQESFALLMPAAALDAPMEGSEGAGRIDWLVAANASDPEDSLIKGDLRRAVIALLDQLPQRHAKILRMRFGIEVHDDCTLEQIARQQGVTRERIRQLEAQALAALRALDAAWVLRGCLE